MICARTPSNKQVSKGLFTATKNHGCSHLFQAGIGWLYALIDVAVVVLGREVQL
jgi:hypothetical protein